MIAFSLWPIKIYWYWIFYLVWFITGYFFLRYIWKKKFFSKYPKLQKLLTKQTEDLIITAIIWVIIGWRLWHILIYDITYYIQHPIEIIAIRKWGMSFIWWIIWTTISISILAKIKKLTKKEFWLLTDMIIMIVPIWILFWRIWNFLNQELYGIIFSNTYNFSEQIITLLKNIQILHIYTNIDTNLRINSNFIASFLEWFITLSIVLTTGLTLIKKQKLTAWFLSWIFLSRYSIARFILEYIRQDSQAEFIWPFSKSQYFFIIFFIIWLALIIKNYNNKNTK